MNYNCSEKSASKAASVMLTSSPDRVEPNKLNFRKKEDICLETRPAASIDLYSQLYRFLVNLAVETADMVHELRRPPQMGQRPIQANQNIAPGLPMTEMDLGASDRHETTRTSKTQDRPQERLQPAPLCCTALQTQDCTASTLCNLQP